MTKSVKQETMRLPLARAAQQGDHQVKGPAWEQIWQQLRSQIGLQVNQQILNQVDRQVRHQIWTWS